MHSSVIILWQPHLVLSIIAQLSSATSTRNKLSVGLRRKKKAPKEEVCVQKQTATSYCRIWPPAPIYNLMSMKQVVPIYNFQYASILLFAHTIRHASKRMWVQDFITELEPWLFRSLHSTPGKAMLLLWWYNRHYDLWPRWSAYATISCKHLHAM